MGSARSWGQLRAGGHEAMHPDPRQVPVLARPQAWTAPNANLWEEVDPESLRAGRTECCTGLPPTPVSQLFPLDFLLHALQAKLRLTDRAVTLVELLDTAGHRCCGQKGVCRGLRPLPWDRWGK